MKNKLILIFLMLFGASLSFAQETGAIYYPAQPVDCREADHPVINWITKFKKTFEDESEAVFSFNFNYGYCSQGRAWVRAINPSDVSVEIYKKEFCLLCRENPIALDYNVISETEVRVTLTVNKKVAFRKSNERRFVMNYIPFYVGGWVRYPNGAFFESRPFIMPWNIDIAFVEETHLNLAPKSEI